MTRAPLTQISSRAWEHPADRAALNTLRAIPGFDDIVRKVAGFFGERGIRQLFLGDAVKVTASQRPRINAMWTEVLETLDWPKRPPGPKLPPDIIARTSEKYAEALRRLTS